MKQFFKKILISLAIIFATSGVVTATTPSSASAATAPCNYFLGLTSWYCGLEAGSDGTPVINNGTDGLNATIWTIASNVLVDMSVIAAYLVLGYVIYGGYLYIFSNGDAGKVANGKKTLTRAFIGLAIVMLSSVILNSMRIAILGNSGSLAANCVTGSDACVDANQMVTNLLQWFIGTAGAVALVYVLVGGVGYITSAGDAGKLQKSKNTIIYALIGIVIVALAEVITSFVSNIIREAGQTSYINNIAIVKEVYEN